MALLRCIAPALIALVPLLAVLPAQAQRCNDDGSVQASTPAVDPTANTDPRVQLQSLVDLSLSRSKQVGAAYLLKLAADADVEESRAQKLPTV